LRGWKKKYLDLDRGAERLRCGVGQLGKERARRRGGGRSDRRGDDTDGREGEEGRRRGINARNYNQRGRRTFCVFALDDYGISVLNPRRHLIVVAVLLIPVLLFHFGLRTFFFSQVSSHLTSVGQSN
jgi:hypothetical protein